MTEENKLKLIVGNWKMYKTIDEAHDFIQELLPLVKGSHSKVFLAVPYTLIHPVSKELVDTEILVGAQNMNDANEGAFTGEIAGKMLVDAGAKFVIIGHSERRSLFQESDEWINKKIKRALKDGLIPILCIGETLNERQEEATSAVLKKQLEQGLAGITEEEMKKVMIAYEPVWAIGSNSAATATIAEKTIEICRQSIEQMYGSNVSNHTKILYGGSVQPENAKLFLREPNIDGLLVGGASLTAEKFSKIINYQQESVL